MSERGGPLNAEEMFEDILRRLRALERGANEHAGQNFTTIEQVYQTIEGMTDHGALEGLEDDDHTQYVLKSLLTTKGDLIVATAAGVLVRLGVGTDGQLVTADSAAPAGVSWQDAAGGGGGATERASYSMNLNPTSSTSGLWDWSGAFNGYFGETDLIDTSDAENPAFPDAGIYAITVTQQIISPGGDGLHRCWLMPLGNSDFGPFMYDRAVTSQTTSVTGSVARYFDANESFQVQWGLTNNEHLTLSAQIQKIS